MRLRKTYGVIGLGVVSAILLALVSIAPLHASPHRSVAPTAVRESNKNKLTDTSIDGPAFWAMPGVNGIVAWTGTDGLHHVNTMRFRSTSTGYVFDNKDTLDETSIAHPAVTVDASQGHAPYYFLAWSGTNTPHSLNVICDGCAPDRIKLTLWNQTSFAGPALAILNDKLMLAWTGDDGNHSLNVLDLSVSNGQFVEGTHTILSGFPSKAGPGLTYDPNQKGIVLSWADKVTGNIKAALSVDGVNWPHAGWTTYPQFTADPPNMLAVLPTTDVAHTYLSWTGIDPGHSLNILYPAYPLQANSNMATFLETALGGPQLGYIGGGRLAIMWTGTDTLHHLNFATLDI